MSAVQIAGITDRAAGLGLWEPGAMCSYSGWIAKELGEMGRISRFIRWMQYIIRIKKSTEIQEKC